jgi:hypothetical protein
MMSERCRQTLRGGVQCTNAAVCRFTWPGRAESFVCETCMPKLRDIARVMELPLELIPLPPNTPEKPKP